MAQFVSLNNFQVMAIKSIFYFFFSTETYFILRNQFSTLQENSLPKDLNFFKNSIKEIIAESIFGFIILKK